MIPILLAATPTGADVALNQWRSCIRASASAYLEIQQSGGQPVETTAAFAETRCWKARATAALALEPVVEQVLVEKGIRRPAIDVIGLVIDRMLDDERDKALQVS